jgi:hypothetical protein
MGHWVSKGILEMVERIPRRKIMVLLGSSADGTDKPPPLVFWKSENPHCFKIIRIFPQDM